VIFVDTSAWYALYIPRDQDHARSNEWRKTHTERLLTTDHVVVETLNLLTVRKEPDRARELSRSLFAEAPARLHRTTDADMRRAREVFERFTDKEWSFTDCVSYAVIERLGIKKAFAFDDHFRQFGIVEVVP